MKTILVDAVFSFVSDQGVIFQEMFELLEKYSNRKIIVTNAPHIKWEQYGLNKVPYEVFTLSQNPPKTDPQYFEMLLSHFGLIKDDIIYFEHSPEAVKSARSLGITSYHYDENKKDLEGLKNFLDKNLK